MLSTSAYGPINRTFSESLIVPDYCLFLKILTRFGNEKLFVKGGVTVNLSPGQSKINGRSQLRSHSLLITRLTKKPCLGFLSNGFVLLWVISS